MSRSYLVYRCKEGELLKKPEAVIALWDEDLNRFSEILDEATASRPSKSRKPGEYSQLRMHGRSCRRECGNHRRTGIAVP